MLGTAGVLLGLFGIVRLLTQVPVLDLLILAVWLIAAVLIHDGVLSPLVLAVGTFVVRAPPRARRYLQFGLVTGALVSVIGVVLIARRNSQPRQKALLLRDYATNLAILLAIIATVSLIAYAVHVARDRGARTGDGDD